MKRLLLITCLLVLPISAEAAITVVTSGAAGSSDNANVTVTLNTGTTTTLLVAVIADYVLSNACTLSDSLSNTWLGGTAYTSSVTRTRTYYATPSMSQIGSGQNFTCAANADSSFPSIAVLAFAGTVTASPTDGTPIGNAANTVTTISPGTLTPTLSTDVFVTGLGWDAGSRTPPTGYTDVGLNYVGTYFGVAAGYKIKTDSAAETPSWTISSSGNPAATLADFKAAVTAPTGPQPGTLATLGVGK